MTTNAEIFKYSAQRAADAIMAHTRTQYVVRVQHAGVNFYARVDMTWTADVAQAYRFDFMTTAFGYACNELSLSLDEFDVDPV